MEKFNLPKLFQNKLEENTALSGLVKTSLGEFSPWLERNNIKFFTEYTDHGLIHIEEVLKEADDLIPEACRDNNFSAADAAVLTLATLLHDCAMHISVDGFIELVESDDRPIIPGFGDKPWKRLWLDFLAEARRFSGRKLMALYGNTEPIQHPPMDSQKMNGRDLLLIGEFLRRHHPRLAHEIALWGVPGPTSEKLKFKPMEDVKFIVELAGIVARSHGMNMRDCADFLKINYGGDKSYKGVHIIFVMALLRIADILQIHSSRAPEQIEKVQKLQSPVSLGEWEMHQSIEYINKNHIDPETILVVSRPENVKTYLRTREMLDQIQKELDQTWTIIGETYAYMPQFRGIGLRYRRIKSNIDDIETFSKNAKYIPTKASFEIADTDLLKLLIGPLYGEQAEIGIRELLQNSLDGVIELQEHIKQNLKHYLEFPNQEADIVISIDKREEDEWRLTISDKGIGMTLNTIKEYFLKAGASLRRSEVWKKTFEDEEGYSRILRSGRFGIGALAAFLIGDEIIVSTRHISCLAEEGIEFSAQLDTESIELRNKKREVGTTITIKMNDNAIQSLVVADNEDEETQKEKKLKWDWFCLNTPKVTRKLNQEVLNQGRLMPAAGSNLPPAWYKIKHPDYQEIHWSYAPNTSIICNGIAIRGDVTDMVISLEDNRIHFNTPTLSIFDPNAKFPLNIQRTGITTPTLPFCNELINDIVKEFIAYLLVEAPIERNQLDTIEYYGLTHNTVPIWASTNTGICPIFEPTLLNKLNKRSCLVVLAIDDKQYIPEKLMTNENCILSINNYETNIYEKINESIGLGFGLKLFETFKEGKTFAVSSHYYGRKIKSARVLVNKKIIQNLEREKKTVNSFIFFHKTEQTDLPMTDDVLSLKQLFGTGNINFTKRFKYKKEFENENWLIASTEDSQNLTFDFEGFIKSGFNSDDSIIAEWGFDNESENKKSQFLKVWEELKLPPVIPYDLREREENLSFAYQELKLYIENYLATKELRKNLNNFD